MHKLRQGFGQDSLLDSRPDLWAWCFRCLVLQQKLDFSDDLRNLLLLGKSMVKLAGCCKASEVPLQKQRPFLLLFLEFTPILLHLHFGEQSVFILVLSVPLVLLFVFVEEH